MICGNCRKYIPENSKFCIYCGSKQSEQVRAPGTPIMPTYGTPPIPYETPLNTYGIPPRPPTDYAPAYQGVVPGPESMVASRDKRLINYLIDSTLGVFIFAFLFYFTLEILGIKKSGTGDESSILVYLFSFLYYLLTEAVWNKTIGKLITGTRVIKKDGTAPDFSNILIRSFVRFIPFEPLSFLFGNPSIGWHDRLSGTLVVKETEYKMGISAPPR
jgi:uncharacterized RDD family membrane protein YckC